MSNLANGLARRAKREQIRLVPKEGNAPRSISARRPDESRRRRSGHPPPGGISVGETTPYVALYTNTFLNLEKLIEATASDDDADRRHFHHAMAFMALLGLRAEDLKEHFKLAPETIMRWISGTRCPHAIMRPLILRQCLEALRQKVEVGRSPAFLRQTGTA